MYKIYHDSIQEGVWFQNLHPDVENADEKPYRGGSSDVGDVTLIAPCATIRFPTSVSNNLPGHHWTIVASGTTSIEHKGITAGAKAACLTAHDLLTKPDILEKIKKEFGKLSQERPYKSFLPDDAEPPLGWNAALMAKYKNEMSKHYIEP